MDASPEQLERLRSLAAGSYLLLTTYKKDGTPVPTPVWVVRDGNALGVWTVTDSWKVKRIRNRADVLVGPCDVRGKSTGDSAPATAELLTPEQTAAYRTLLRRKYGLLGVVTLLGSKLRRGDRGTIGIRITLKD
ncbi:MULTISPECIES: PPOX class F420-dependent oxidoreductase [unclassified Kitasatospora]|uniref:PPOX class F420-dependent oxidoreductase n=1 Tax=unclassified Kitasatospora TaxID=2633591 RepID=UPI00070933CC|nr:MULTISPECIES: PPOX class F420-dependent oxidoreductase [unclassified Kitasatospora]KQV04480.1 pyridoxamine 5-phosphate oxidase [Kitasatospora sp. Root107]KRB60989.1 pyridoxamine 5-phosphate oxidase [Kitasatospora sp. Root187]